MRFFSLYFYIFFFLRLAAPSTLYAKSIYLDPDSQEINLSSLSKVLMTSKDLSLEEIEKLLEEGAFQKEASQAPSYGFKAQHYWYYFKAQNGFQQPYNWYLGFENPLINRVEIFFKNSKGEWQKKITGIDIESTKRDVKSRLLYLEIPFEAGVQKDFFVHLRTNHPAEFKMFFRSYQKIYENDHKSQLLFGIFIGLILILAVYYLLIGIRTMEKEPLTLGFYFFSIFLLHLSTSGLSSEYLWASTPWMTTITLKTVLPICFFLALLNTYFFIPMKKSPLIKKTTEFLLMINILAVVVGFFVSYVHSGKYFFAIGLSTIFYIIIVSLIHSILGFKPARIFILAWFPSMIFSLVLMIQKMGFMPSSELFTYGINVTSLLLVIITAFAHEQKIYEDTETLAATQVKTLDSQKEAKRLQSELKNKLEKEVLQREEKLWQQKKSIRIILESLNQGVFTIDKFCQILPDYSKKLEEITGIKNLSGLSLIEIFFNKSSLGTQEKSSVSSIINLTIGNKKDYFNQNHHLLPSEFLYEPYSEHPKIFDLSWALIEDEEENVEKILVSIKDITLLRKAEEIAKNKKLEKKSIENMFDLSFEKFSRFIKSTQILIEESLGYLDNNKKNNSRLNLLRNIHTIKGNARTYQFEDISLIAHNLENIIYEDKNSLMSSKILDACYKEMRQIKSKINFYEELNKKSFYRKSILEIEKIILEAKDILNKSWPFLDQKIKSKYIFIAKKILQMNQNSFLKSIQPIIDSIPSLANDLGKVEPILEIVGSDFEIDKNSINIFEDVFVHLIRNSLDHGFSTKEQGKIRIQIFHDKDYTRIVYSDTGKGLNLEVLRKKAQDKKLIIPNADDLMVAMTIFMPGISSASSVTQISGRGIGMDAVKAALEKMGGAINITLLGESFIEGCKRFQFDIELPKQKKLEDISI